MTYEEALKYIHGTHKFGMKLGLQNISKLLELMGNPHRHMKNVHVAGTNGKGSTVAFISSVLVEAGYRVGIYISPYIERFTERIRVNDKDIGREDLGRITGFVRGKVDMMLREGESHPTEFEIVTAIGFQYFHEMQCDVVVLEVGLGGRFDSTNVIDTPLVSVITSISLDHTGILGDTLPRIAFEKAGIIKSGGDVVVYPQADEVEKVFEEVCIQRGARLRKADFNRIHISGYGIDGQTFSYKDFQSLRISLLGEHQTKNAVLAVEALLLLQEKGFNISGDSIRRGLERARWPGRMEVLSRNPVFIIDGAHNKEGAEVLYNTLRTYFPQKKVIFIIGVLQDKDYKSMIETVLPLAGSFITVTPENERALPAEKLAIIIRSYCKKVLISDTIEEAVRTSLQISSEDDIVCAFGSLYYIGKVRGCFLDTLNNV